MKTFFTIVLFSLTFSVSKAAIINVTAADSTFKPANISIHVGDVVHWNFLSEHTATSGTNCSPDGKFDSGDKVNGNTYDFNFTTAGSYPYYCQYHCTMGMVGTITVSAVSGIETYGSLQNIFKIYPNPFNQNTNVDYNLNQSAKVNIDVTNMIGQKVWSIELYQGAGTYTQVVEMTKLAKGMYVMHLSLDGILAKETELIKQ